MNPCEINAARLRSTLEGLTRVCSSLLAALCLSVTVAAQTTDFVELASPNAAGTNAGNVYSLAPRASADGRFLVFVSEATDLVAGDANSTGDVFVRDLQTDTTRLVSVNASGTGTGNGSSHAASMTPDGRFVLFASDASDLVANDSNGEKDIFVRDLQQNTTTLVSVNSAGNAPGDRASLSGFLTPDGRYAVFNSAATNLVAGVGLGNQASNVFRRDLQTNTTIVVSVNPAGTSEGNGPSDAQAVTPDGRFVLFQSSASDLTANDTNGSTWDIFRRDLQTNTTALASVNSTGNGSGNNAASEGVMSEDGRVVAFTSLANDLLPHPGQGRDYTTPAVYEHDFGTNTTKLVSEVQVFENPPVVTVPPARLPRISADGRYIFYLRYENFISLLNRVGFRDRIFRRDRQTGDLLELPFVSSGICALGFNCRTFIGNYATTGDGRYVAYSQSERSRNNPLPFSQSLVIRDLVGGGTEVVNGLTRFTFLMPGELPPALNLGNVVAGGKLAFSSTFAHAAADTNAAEDVYLFSPPTHNRLAFERPSYFTQEEVSGPAFFFRVRRAGFLLNSTVTVKFATADGTAHAGSDYVARSETLTFAPGEIEKTLEVLAINDEVTDPNETIMLTLSEPTGNSALGTQSVATLTIRDDDPHVIEFDFFNDYDVSEAEFSLLVNVRLTGVPTTPVSVAYSTSDGTASERADYVTARGRLTFAPGETSKSFRILVVNDVFVEGDETINLTLSDPRGASVVLGPSKTAVVRITSDDASAPASNPIDSSEFFVRQHYYDFLNRLPDAEGFQFWQNEIESCGPNPSCREVKRINVSAAFFLSIEFQTTGYLGYLTHKTAFGTRPLYTQFMYDVQTLQRDFVFGEDGAAARLEANKRAYFDEFVTRTAFIAKYAGMNNADYVSTLLNDNGLSRTVGNIFVARLDAAQVAPQTVSGATGVVYIRRAPSGTSPVATVSLSLQNLTGPPTAVHLHGPAAPGENAPQIITLPNGEFTDFQLTLTNEQINWLNTGQLYIDVHTSGFPDGEIRARLGPALFRVDVLTNALNTQMLTRAQVLRAVAEFDELKAAEFNRAFVLMEYFGYLRRDPDEDGYNFWLGKLDSFGGNFINAEMVKAFINSAEYRQRFGP